MNCPLCLETNHRQFFEDKNRIYHRCEDCSLVFVLKEYLLNPEEEKKIYDLHENSVDDLEYQNFLSRLFNPLAEKLNSGSLGLDFGCGNGPALAAMFEGRGHHVELYDKYYYDQPQVFNKYYDFIVATEVFEHLYRPAYEMKRLVKILKVGGYLGIMTKLVLDKESFSRWHYKNDLTHVCFYSRETFDWIAKSWNLEIAYLEADVIILSMS